MSLPKGFKRLEYIQSSGTQYVDSKFVPNSNTRVVADYESTETQGAVIGSDTKWLTNDFVIEVHFAAFGATSYNHASVPTGRHTAELNKGAFIFDGATLTTMSGSFTGAYSLTLFALNRSNTIQEYGTLKLYSCQIYDNGTLVRDYIPCQNASGAVGLWDAVNEEFYGNAGTGTFTAGPVVPEIVDESEITELEYIQSSGAQYANTGFVSNQNTRVVMDAQFTSTPTALVALFGARGSSSSQHFVFYNTDSKFYLRFGGGTNNAVSATPTDRNVFDLNKNTLSVGSNSITAATATFSAAQDMYLFAIHDAVENAAGEARYLAAFKLFSCQIYDNGLLERDYIPAMLANGEVGLYDRVFHAFYRNAGTGEFIAGPEMAHEGYTELVYIESSGAQLVETEFTPNQDTRVVMDFDLTSMSSEGWASLFATRTNNAAVNSFALFSNKTFTAAYEQYATQTLQPTVSLKGRHLVDKKKNVTSLDGAVISTFTYEEFTGDVPLRLLWESSATPGQNYPFIGYLYSCQIYDNGTEVRIYIPMRHPSGVAGLWDSVNERFYASATTTDFLAGPEAQTVPKAPSNFRVKAETNTLVTLAWDAVEDALGYRLYRQGQLLADTTETSVSVTVEPFAGAVFTLTAYNENGEGAGAELTYFNAPDDPILFLVTDRTQRDVTERNQKGYYAASDLNRVGFAVEYLAGRLKDSGVSVTVSPVLTWTDEEWATPAAMTAYLKDVQTMRNALKVAETTPTAPEDMANLTYFEANDIEAILVALDVHITRMLSIVDAGWASGLAYTGFYAKEAY